MKKTFAITLVFALLISMGGCGETNRDIRITDPPEREVSVDRTAMFTAYAEILEAERERMTISDPSSPNSPETVQTLDIGEGKVEVLDVDGDNVPELVYLTRIEDYEEWLNVMTWRDGKAVRVFEQRVRSLAGGGGNYSAFVTECDELWVYASAKDETFEYGFWNVSEALREGPVDVNFIGDSDKAKLYSSILLSEESLPTQYYMGGRAAGEADAKAWLEVWSSTGNPTAISYVLMDSERSQIVNYEDKIIDVGLYSEKYGPWVKYVINPLGEQCMTWDFAWASLRGDQGSLFSIFN